MGYVMAVCKTCGKKIGLMDNLSGLGGDCFACYNSNKALNEPPIGTKATAFTDRSDNAVTRRKDQEVAAIDAVLLTTETAVNLNITRRIEIVTAECAFGMNIFKDLFSGIRDIVGERSEAVQKTMRDARKTTLFELKPKPIWLGPTRLLGWT